MMHDPRSISAGVIDRRVSKQSASTRISGHGMVASSNPLGRDIGRGKAWELITEAVMIKLSVNLLPAFKSRQYRCPASLHHTRGLSCLA
jgi:hypothetical protein